MCQGSGGSDMMGLLRLGHKRQYSFFLFLMGHVLLEPSHDEVRNPQKVQGDWHEGEPCSLAYSPAELPACIYYQHGSQASQPPWKQILQPQGSHPHWWDKEQRQAVNAMHSPHCRFGSKWEDGGCFKPLSFREVCYVTIASWHTIIDSICLYSI